MKQTLHDVPRCDDVDVTLIVLYFEILAVSLGFLGGLGFSCGIHNVAGSRVY